MRCGTPLDDQAIALSMLGIGRAPHRATHRTIARNDRSRHRFHAVAEKVGHLVDEEQRQHLNTAGAHLNFIAEVLTDRLRIISRKIDCELAPISSPRFKFGCLVSSTKGSPEPSG